MNTSDQVVLIGMMTEKNDTELFQHLRYEPLFGEIIKKQGTVFFGSSFKYTNEVVDIIQKNVRNFAEYYKESLLSESIEPESVKVKDPLKVRLKRYEHLQRHYFSIIRMSFAG